MIAYQAESTLAWVLGRIPTEVFADFACEVLVVDDASEDRTYRIGTEYSREHPDLPLTVLRNRVNQGYGGNQKIRYSYAIQNGFDLVAMVHGDGQYAPEELPRLLAGFQDPGVSAVFGSRMIRSRDALKGGMPFYKWIGNRILSGVQNFLLRTHFSEFHSGYRIYRVSELKRIRFSLNSNGFVFDTEIILQLLNAEARIVELTIPTYYGDEICRVNGIKYAFEVFNATLVCAIHRLGLRHQRRLEPIRPGNTNYELKLGYPSTHQWVLDRIPDGSSVIDIGSGPGGMAAELIKKRCRVAVVDRYPPAVPDLECDVFVQDLDEDLRFRIDDFGYLLLLDIIEHLKNPEEFLDRLRSQFTHDEKTLILTTPNIGFVIPRLALAFGQFNYGESGIPDRTHTRLFTFRTLRLMLRDAGFKIQEVRGVPAPLAKAIGDGFLAKVFSGINLFLIRISKKLFAFQILVVAKTSPDLNFLLGDAAREKPPDVVRQTWSCERVSRMGSGRGRFSGAHGDCPGIQWGASGAWGIVGGQRSRATPADSFGWEVRGLVADRWLYGPIRGRVFCLDW